MSHYQEPRDNFGRPPRGNFDGPVRREDNRDGKREYRNDNRPSYNDRPHDGQRFNQGADHRGYSQNERQGQHPYSSSNYSSHGNDRNGHQPERQRGPDPPHDQQRYYARDAPRDREFVRGGHGSSNQGNGAPRDMGHGGGYNGHRPEDRRQDDYRPGDRGQDDRRHGDRGQDDRRQGDRRQGDRRQDDRRHGDRGQDDRRPADQYNSGQRNERDQRPYHQNHNQGGHGSHTNDDYKYTPRDNNQASSPRSYQNERNHSNNSGMNNYHNDPQGNENHRGHNDSGFTTSGGRGFHNDSGFGHGERNNGPQGRYQSDSNYNSNDRNSSFHNDNGFGSGGRDNSNRGKFQNDGGYRESEGGQTGTEDKEPERAPRDWVPQKRDVGEMMDDTAQKVQECQVSQDQAVEIRNSDIDTRLTSWDNSGLHEKILKNLQRLKYTQVRTIQAAMIPQVFAGYDVIGQAETSAGKTAAFGLPIVNYILNLEDRDRQRSFENVAPFALILSPTRELASQIYDSLRLFSRDTDIKVCLSYGQQCRRTSLREIQEGCDILIGTCGRIMDLVQKSDISMSELKFFVLDEADRLLQEAKNDAVGHMSRILDDHEFKNSAERRQTIMTSATFDRNVEDIAHTLMKKLPNETDFVRIVLTNSRLSNRVNLVFYETSGLTEKLSKMKEILSETNQHGDAPKTLIFVQTKKSCDFLAVRVAQYGSIIRSQTLHGDRSQDKRDQYIHDFKTGQLNVMVTTDVLSRGIDVTDLERVINYDIPDGSVDTATDTFIHRSGRTGRMHTGVCISFVNPKSESDGRLAPKLVELIKSQGKKEEEIPGFLVNLARENANKVHTDVGYGRGGGGRGGRGGSYGSRGGGFAGSATGSFNRTGPTSGGFGAMKSGGGGFGATKPVGSTTVGGGFGATSSVGGGFGSTSTGSGFGAPRTEGTNGTSNDEAAPAVVGGGFGQPKAPTGFGAADSEEKNGENKPQGFGSKAAQEAKAAAQSLGSSTFGASTDDKKNETAEDEDDDW